MEPVPVEAVGGVSFAPDNVVKNTVSANSGAVDNTRPRVARRLVFTSKCIWSSWSAPHRCMPLGTISAYLETCTIFVAPGPTSTGVHETSLASFLALTALPCTNSTRCEPGKQARHARDGPLLFMR